MDILDEYEHAHNGSCGLSKTIVNNTLEGLYNNKNHTKDKKKENYRSKFKRLFIDNLLPSEGAHKQFLQNQVGQNQPKAEQCHNFMVPKPQVQNGQSVPALEVAQDQQRLLDDAKKLHSEQKLQKVVDQLKDCLKEGLVAIEKGDNDAALAMSALAIDTGSEYTEKINNIKVFVNELFEDIFINSSIYNTKERKKEYYSQLFYTWLIEKLNKLHFQ